MLDFVDLKVEHTKKGVEFSPRFKCIESEHLMIKGSKFYAMYNDSTGLWTRNPFTACKIIDALVVRKANEWLNHNTAIRDDPSVKKIFLLLEDGDSKQIDKFWHYCEKQMRDWFKPLDYQLIFADHDVKITDYATFKLGYSITDTPTPAYDEMMSTFYVPQERKKIEWYIGAILVGDSAWIQKFLAIYGEGGTGKGTIINEVIEKLFSLDDDNKYYTTFHAESLGSSSNAFPLEPFRNDPIVAIDADAKLNKIETNTNLNSLVAHEKTLFNVKYQSSYMSAVRSAIIMGTNYPITITDAKSGLIRRLIDVSTTGKTIPSRRYLALVDQLKFELGGIAYRCKKVYLSNKHAYDKYIPTVMLEKTNEFYNFLKEPDIFRKLKEADEITLNAAWAMYDTYVKDTNLQYKTTKTKLREELKNYFRNFTPEARKVVDGRSIHVYNLYSGFKLEKFQSVIEEEESTADISKGPFEKSCGWIVLEDQASLLDDILKDCPAQLTVDDNGQIRPARKWINCKTRLADIDTRELHYVKVPLCHIVLDFDICDESGEKSLERNLEMASHYPETYCEVSRSGKGIHLHYIWDGNPLELADHIGDKVEIKVFSGDQPLRRKLTFCNSIPVRHLNSGLPLKPKGVINTVKDKTLNDEKHLRNIIAKALRKETPKLGYTKGEVEWIKKCLDKAYESGIHYDLTDISDDIYAFCLGSSNNSDYCLKLFDQMIFRSDEIAGNNPDGLDKPLAFFDFEVYPNFSCLVVEPDNSDKQIRLENPEPDVVESVTKSMNLIGFNNWNYDNSIAWARIMHYNNADLYSLSQGIISGEIQKFHEAKNVSYTDIYGYSTKKQSLKKWEIEMGIHHQEMGIPWDQPVPDNMKVKVVEYCGNDVSATKALFHYLTGDWEAHQILVKLAELIGGVPSTVNDSTNNLTARIIFGNDKHPQSQFNYRDMSKKLDDSMWTIDDILSGNPHAHIKYGKPYFPGYVFDGKTSTYRGIVVGEGGLVFADYIKYTDEKGKEKTKIGPKIYRNIKVQDVRSQHPSSTIAEELFGPVYTPIYAELVKARACFKHRDYEGAAKCFNGALKPFLVDITDEKAKNIAAALKIAINAVYGQTAAHYPNAFRDEHNVDNIVAKRGALFMCDLKYALQLRYPDHTVVHIKTDSIKVEDTTDEIIEFIRMIGDAYGYEFETENEFDRMCLVNNSVYIAHKTDGEWEAVGTQFAVPYVHKTLFTGDDISFDDKCVTQSVTKGALYLDMNEGLIDVSAEEKQLEDLRKVMRETDYEKQVKLFNRYEKKYGADILNTTDCLVGHEKELQDYIAHGHNYVFVGRVGRFCPVKPGCGGGLLYRKDGDKYFAASGSSDYRWIESEVLMNLNREEDIDLRYFDDLVDKAAEAISERYDYRLFCSDEFGMEQPEDFMNVPEGTNCEEEIPFR